MKTFCSYNFEGDSIDIFSEFDEYDSNSPN